MKKLKYITVIFVFLSRGTFLFAQQSPEIKKWNWKQDREVFDVMETGNNFEQENKPIKKNSRLYKSIAQQVEKNRPNETFTDLCYIKKPAGKKPACFFVQYSNHESKFAFAVYRQWPDSLEKLLEESGQMLSLTETTNGWNLVTGIKPCCAMQHYQTCTFDIRQGENIRKLKQKFLLVPYLKDTVQWLPVQTSAPVQKRLVLRGQLHYTPWLLLGAENHDIPYPTNGTMIDTLTKGTMVKIYHTFILNGGNLYFVSINSPSKKTKTIIQKLHPVKMDAEVIEVFGWLRDVALGEAEKP